MFEEMQYGRSYHCVWVLEAPAGQVIKMNGQIESGGKVAIYDAPIKIASRILTNAEQPQKIRINSTGRYLVVEIWLRQFNEYWFSLSGHSVVDMSPIHVRMEKVTP